jgi:hypothetical protein
MLCIVMAEMSIGAVAMVDLVAKSRTAQTDAQTECVTRFEECRAVSGSDNAWFDIGVWCEHGCTNGVCNAAPVEPGAPGGVTETPPFEVYVGGGISCPAGAPSVTLDTAVQGEEAFAYYKAQPVTYVGVMNIFVHNLHSECFAYFAWEMRMWPGKAGTTCPEIPSHFEGYKTICLSLWGNYSKQALLDELAAAGYAEEIPW